MHHLPAESVTEWERTQRTVKMRSTVVRRHLSFRFRFRFRFRLFVSPPAPILENGCSFFADRRRRLSQ
jgi:hypothetical protein